MNIKRMIEAKYENIEQTEAVCLEAVKQDAYAVYYFSAKMESHFLGKDKKNG